MDPLQAVVPEEELGSTPTNLPDLPPLSTSTSVESSAPSDDNCDDVLETDGTKEGKVFPKESSMNVTSDNPSIESIDHMTRFVERGILKGGYGACIGNNNKTKYMQDFLNTEFKYDGLFNEYKKPNYGKFTKYFYNGLKQLEVLTKSSHATADGEHGEDYPVYIKDLVSKYMKFVQSNETQDGLTQAAKNSLIQANLITLTAPIGSDTTAPPRTSVTKTNKKHGFDVAKPDASAIAYNEKDSLIVNKKTKKMPEQNEFKSTVQSHYETSLVHLEVEKQRYVFKAAQIELRKAHLSAVREEKKEKRRMKELNGLIASYKDLRDAEDDEEQRKMYNKEIAQLLKQRINAMNGKSSNQNDQGEKSTESFSLDVEIID